MNRETEKIFKAFEKYLEGKEIASQEMMEEEFKKFMDIYNNGAFETEEEDAWDYFELAQEADNEKDALKYAKKALRLDKNFLDAEVMIKELTAKSDEELKRNYEKLMAKEEKRLKEADIWIEENIGDFWGILETRPYLRLRYSYLKLLISQGKLGKAVKECEELLELSERDNLGVRYILMGLYAFFEDEFNIIGLQKRYKEEESPQMFLPLIAFYYKVDNYRKADAYLKKLKQVNDELADFLIFLEDAGELEDMEIREIFDSGVYRPGSKEELMIATLEATFLYSTTGGLLTWMAERVMPF